ncbi:MAG TPA: dihydrofolate reductase family protein [Terriglobales bacterium]|nr:dihydrofolate reductase family protein [Terriglobales bacterium]
MEPMEGSAVRKLIMWNLMSLDGFVEGPNRDISWHDQVWRTELEQFSLEQGKEIGALLFGRVTYELMAGYWPTAKRTTVSDYMNLLPKYVFSRTLEKVDWENTTLLKGDPAVEVGRLKRGEGKDIFVFGSADLASYLMPLFDEFRIGLAPLLLGSGSPLFKQRGETAKLKLLGTERHSTGVVILRYLQQG